MKIPQTYHHVVLHSNSIHEEYIINAPLDVEEMYNFTKKRLANLAIRTEIKFHDTVTDNPGCPEVISLNSYAYKLSGMNGNVVHTICKTL